MTRSCILLTSALLLIGLSASAQQRPIQLEEAISMALAQNRTIAMAHTDTEHYKRLKDKARADYFPHIANNSEVSYITDREGIVIPAGSFGAPAATGPIPRQSLRIDQGGNATYFARTQLTQPLTQLFGIYQQNRAATADVHSSIAAETNTAIETVANVHRHFYGVLVQHQQVVAAQSSLSAAREREHEAEANVKEGSAVNSDLSKARSQRAQAEQAVIAAETQERAERIQLNTLLALPVDTALDPKLPPQIQAGLQPLPSRSDALTLALAHEPHVLQAAAEVEKARAGVRSAEDAYIPSITATAHESYQSGVAFFVHNYGIFSGQVSIDVFDGGKRRAEVQAAKALLAKAQLALDEQREQTSASVEVTYDQVDEAQSELQSKRLADVAAADAERIADAQFRNGEILPSQRDQAIASHASSQASVLEAELDLLLARVQVQRVLGQIPH